MTPKTKNNIGRFQALIIIFVWMLLFSLPLLFGTNREIDWIHILKIWTEYALVFLIFIFNRLVLLPKLFFKEKRVLYFTSLLISFIILAFSIFIFGDYAFEIAQTNHFLPLEIPDMPIPPNVASEEFIPPFANLLILAILMIGFDTGLIISVKWIRLEQNKLQLEKENIETKMAFLQNQISPHFFMNTLNNIHALVDIDTEDAKDAIIKLSKLMGYIIYESQAEKIAIQKEMNFVRSFVELMKIRFTDDVIIELHIPEHLPNVSIPTLLTISFIENAFKHGISYQENSFISITFSFTANRLFFEIKNTIQNKTIKPKNSGLGIENARNRLNLIYGNDYELVIEQVNNKIFFVKLNIPI